MSKKGENIRKRKDGRWEGRYLQEVDGEKKYRSVYAKTYSEVKKKLTEEKARQHEAVQRKTGGCSNMTLHELSGSWFSEVKTLRKYSTYRKYMDIYENYIHNQLGNLPAQEITSDAVAKSLPIQLSASTHRSIYCVLNQMLCYGTVHFNLPDIKLQPCIAAKKAKPIEILSLCDQRMLLEQMYSDMDSCKLGIVICLSTGLRLGEICSLKWDDIDFQSGILCVNRTVQRVRKSSGDRKTMLVESVPKTACSRREIPLSDHLMKIMAQFQGTDPYVLKDGSSPMDPRTYQYRFHAYLRAADIPEKNFHILRHTFATNCINNGADVKCVSELLGHSNVNITLNKYVHPAMDVKRNCMNSLTSIYGQIMGHVS